MIQQNNISDILNLIGYGLAKFDLAFAREFGCQSKSAFYRYVVQIGLANTEKAVSNRQDGFDPYFDNGRRGWYQRNQREHIKLFIDSLFGNEDAIGFANIVKMFLKDLNSNIDISNIITPPSIQSKFKQLQETGKEAEFYFMQNFQDVPLFMGGELEDARLLGDGYDFQIKTLDNQFLLAEVKGVKTKTGSIRMTQNEYFKASEYLSQYILVVVSTLLNTPKLSYFVNPLSVITFEPSQIKSIQTNYCSNSITW